jgi:hypothetical protein
MAECKHVFAYAAPEGEEYAITCRFCGLVVAQTCIRIRTS